ncbi:hypothetical protein N9B90_00800, partial [bacterium]|nr:hypothetical protein [bacterium]
LATVEGDEHFVRLWSLPDLSPLGQLGDHSAALAQIQFAKDGSRLLTACRDQSIRAIRLSDGHCISKSTISSPFQFATFSPDGQLLLTYKTRSGTAHLWNTNDGSEVLHFSAQRGALRWGTINSNGTWAATCADDGTTCIWPTNPVEVATAKRVLVAGDSLVFGYGVEDEEALPACIELALQEGGVAAVVGNAGVPSFGSSHAVSRMALLDSDFQADALVVCGFIGNDAIDDALPTRVVYAGLVHLWPMAQLVQSSWRTRLAMRSRVALWWESWVFTNHPESSPIAQAMPDPRDIERSVGLPPVAMRLAGLFLDARDEQVCFTAENQPVLPRLNGYLRESLQRAKDLAGTRPLIFVILPTSWQVNDSKRVQVLKSWGLNPSDYEAGLGQARWASIARDLGIVAFDATPILRAAGSSDELFIEDGGHLSVYGNKVVGQWLAAEIADLLR